ncbi:Phosphoribosyl-ATP pyrophosphohydrolase-like [Dillenia turbinata]|uniref:Phosphoribosyl-ATP pyrophosphohydrolase-like n=1 Tax=Dillenia turbinata TaxID=194707 RepID=A0AAN8VU42_9MAGN
MAVSFTHCLQNLGLYSRSHLSCQRDSLEGKSHHVVNACLQKSGYDLAMNSKVGLLLDSVKWDEKGLAVAIAQNVDTGAILMQGFANKDALATTISSRKATFYSRSRSALWTKGETSMNFINVYDIFLDCDRDSIIYLGKPDGPTCHTGSDTCYFSSVFDLLKHPQLLCSKIREEADELCRTLEENEDKARTASEMADVLYHSMVLLALRGVQIEEVLQVLRQRFFKSGIEEKESRKA